MITKLVAVLLNSNAAWHMTNNNITTRGQIRLKMLHFSQGPTFLFEHAG